MNLIETFIKLDVSKLFSQGNITKAYEKMYLIAERIANHELKIEGMRLQGSLVGNDNPYKVFKIQKEMAEFKQKRIQHHINEMKKLLELRENLNKK